MDFTLRRYKSSDIQQVLRLFLNTVRTVNLKDYSEEQVRAWATGKEGAAAWDASLRSHLCYVAVAGEQIVGFGDMDASGYLDRLYVHKDYQRQGVATALCDRLEGETSTMRYSVHASITALPFFQHRGYRIVRSQIVNRQGVLLKNFVMEKQPDCSSM